MLHQAMLSNASFDAENSENWLLFVLFSQTAFSAYKLFSLAQCCMIIFNGV